MAREDIEALLEVELGISSSQPVARLSFAIRSLTWFTTRCCSGSAFFHSATNSS